MKEKEIKGFCIVCNEIKPLYKVYDGYGNSYTVHKICVSCFNSYNRYHGERFILEAVHNRRSNLKSEFTKTLDKTVQDWHNPPVAKCIQNKDAEDMISKDTFCEIIGMEKKLSDDDLLQCVEYLKSILHNRSVKSSRSGKKKGKGN